MRRSPLKRRTPLKATRRQPNPMTAAGREARAAWAANLGPCVVCPTEGGVCAGPVQGHHAIAKQSLKRHGLHRVLWDPRNRVPVCEHRHEQHTTRYRPIPRSLLPASVFEFADELGLGRYIDKVYGEAVAG
jgi:hypothetical protein